MNFSSFLIGAFGMLFLSAVIFDHSVPNQQFREIKELKEKCEEPLPRNEHCVIIAVPTSKD